MRRTSKILVFCVLILFALNLGYAKDQKPANPVPKGPPMAEENYDDKVQAQVNIMEDDSALLRRTKLSFMFQKVHSGDKNIMRLVTKDTFEAFHDDILCKINKNNEKSEYAYYEELGKAKAVPAFIGGLDNLDPEVRLKCIGYLGDWVDEVGGSLELIKKEVEKRLQVTDEKRPEVRYALRVLKMKVVRRQTLEKMKGGEIKVLESITPEDFMGIVFYEPRIRTIMLGSPIGVNIRAITLDRGVDPVSGQLIGDRPGRAAGLDIERICYNWEVPEGKVSGITDNGKVAKYFYDQRKWREKGELVPVSVDDAELPNSEVVLVDNENEIDWNCVRSLYHGLNNKSLFVREQCARIFLNYMARFSGDRGYLICNKKYSPKLAKFRDFDDDRRIAMVAWENCKFGEYYFSDKGGKTMENMGKYKYYFEADKSNYQEFTTTRYFTQYVQSFPHWQSELTGNYRNDLKEILRILGLAFYFDPDYSSVIMDEEVKGRMHYRYLVTDTLFDERKPSKEEWKPIGDVLQGQAFQLP